MDLFDTSTDPTLVDQPSYLRLVGMAISLETDFAPAFSILMAPSFPKNSKNLLVQDRSVHEAYRDKILTPVHVLSKGFATDLNATDPRISKPKEPNYSTSPRTLPSRNTSNSGPSSYPPSPYSRTVSLHYSDNPYLRTPAKIYLSGA
jgi:hypothetical protein